MRVETCTDPGHPGRANEDFLGVRSGVAVLVDGAGTTGVDRLCRHGVAWWARMLGEAALRRAEGGAGLPDALASSLAEVAGLHRGTCTLDDDSSPQGCLAMVRVRGATVEHLVLGDVVVLLESPDGTVEVVHDDREAAARGCRVAREDPRVAGRAAHGVTAAGGLAAVAVVSRGVTREARADGPAGWRRLVATLRDAGPHELVARVRAAEAADPALEPDDASVAYLDLRGLSPSPRAAAARR